MVSVVNNINTNNMKISRANVGIITPPDYIHNPKFHNSENTKADNVNTKTSTQKEKINYHHKTKTPTGIVLLFGISALAVLFTITRSFFPKIGSKIKP